MKTLKITYKNGNEIMMNGIYDFNIEDGKLYLSKKPTFGVGIASLSIINMHNMTSVQEV